MLAISAMFAQGVTRQMVSIEDATGTWCTYCPGAAMGCDDLLSGGKFVGVIANHNGDPYANTFSNQRNTMYAVSAFPSVGFDGNKGYVGGNHSSSLYNTYLPIYNSLITLESPVSMNMVVTHTGLDYTAVITLEKVGTITSTSNILFFFVTQSHMSVNWQGQNHLEHVNRLMVGGTAGTAVDFTGGNIQTVTLNFTMDASWPIADCEFVTFLQNKDAGQGNQGGTSGSYILKKYVVYQCVKQGTIDLSVDFTASNNEIMQGESITYTNATNGGYIGVPETYAWTFPGGTPTTSTDKNPVVTYDMGGSFDVQLIVNRGGQIDTVIKNSMIHVIGVGVSEQAGNQIIVSPNPSNGNFKLTFNVAKSFVADLFVRNANGSTVYSESNVTISNDLTKTIRATGLASGVYFLTIQNGDNKLVKKILIN